MCTMLETGIVTLSGGVGPYMTGIGQLDAACSVSMIPLVAALLVRNRLPARLAKEGNAG